MDDTIVALIIGLIIFAVVFLLLRELFTWYWKVNEILSELRKANQMLQVIASYTGNSKQPPSESEPPTNIPS